MEEHVEVKESNIAGKGVFATKKFQEGEFVLKIRGDIIEVEDPHSLPLDVLEHTFPIEIKNNKFRLIVQLPPCKFLNHSCNPNAGLQNNEQRDIINVMALKPIEKGEEILFDYAMCNIDEFTMNCKCGSSNCKKRMVPFENLDESTQQRYLPYVLDYIRKRHEQKEI